MRRDWILACVSTIAALVLLTGLPSNADAWIGSGINSPYRPFCRSGHCGGGDYYLGSWIHHSGRRQACPCNSGCYGGSTDTSGLYTNDINNPIRGYPSRITGSTYSSQPNPMPPSR